MEEVYILTGKQIRDIIVHAFDSGDRFIPPSLNAVTRFEVIDWRPCATCDDKGLILVDDKPVNCPKHTGGRAFVAYNIKSSLSIQDEGRTLKAFIEERDDASVL